LTETFHINEHSHYGILDLQQFAALQGLSAKREIEGKGKEYLAQLLLGGPCEIVYDDKGKPHIKDKPVHISLTHSHEKLALIVNTHEPTGIDIELIRDKVHRIRHKFLNAAEMACAGDHTEKLLVYWAAKETLYKIYGLKEVDFIAHLSVADFAFGEKGTIEGRISLPGLDKRYALHYEQTGDYILTYALHELTGNPTT